MVKKIYAIMGATGHIGHVLAQDLLRHGHQVRAIGRNPKKLSLLKTLGAEIITLDNFDDANHLKDAFHRADAVFSLLPPDPSVEDYGAFQDKVGEAIKSAIKKSKVGHVLNLSSIGGEIPSGTGPIAGLHRHEERLNGLSGVNVLHLRPGWFMENLMQLIPSIKANGAIHYSLREDLPLQMVATIDIGKKATELMNRLDFRGHSFFEFMGPRDVTMKETAAILGKALGKSDVKYVQVSPEDFEKALVASGIKPQLAGLYREMNTAFNEGKIQFNQRLTPEHRGKTSLDEFAKEFSHAFQRAT